MSYNIILIPINKNVGLNSLILGIKYLLKSKGKKIKVISPIKSFINNELHLFNQKNSEKKSIFITKVKNLLASNQQDILMDKIINIVEKNKKNKDLIIIKGLSLNNEKQFAHYLNYEIANNLNAEIIFVASMENNSFFKINEQINIIKNVFFNINKKNFIKVIINKINAPTNQNNINFFNISNKKKNIVEPNLFFEKNKIVNYIPWENKLIYSRAIDICKYLQAEIINFGEINIRRIKLVLYFLEENEIKINLIKHALLIISAYQTKILQLVFNKIIKGAKISGILITNAKNFDIKTIKFYKNIFKTLLPIFKTDYNIIETYSKLSNFDFKLLHDDTVKIKMIKKHFSKNINYNLFEYNDLTTNKKNIGPYFFLYKIKKLAKLYNKKILLPESNDIRIIEAASICSKKRIAKCILLGDMSKITLLANTNNIDLKNVDIINPKLIRNQYIKKLVKIRKNKGMNEIIAQEKLKNNIILGTMMLQNNDIDGLVSGVVNTTADTVLPALQIIKTKKNSNLISSLFFMLLPNKVLIYADCAINKNPTAEQLAEIAIQSADSAKLFDIEPIIAMISYSTGNSATGKDVEKVKQATEIVQFKRPDLLIDGPLQYDAAIISDVAKLKLPNSLVAGKANVLIFPDLNTGNTVYKAVQRSTNIISIGPILQGINKPVNDLSRGASVKDIVYTIALTAIQSYKKNV